MVQLLKLSKNDLKKIIYKYNYHTKIKNYRTMTKEQLKKEILKRLIYEDGKFYIIPNPELVELPIKKDRWVNIQTQNIDGNDDGDDVEEDKTMDIKELKIENEDKENNEEVKENNEEVKKKIKKTKQPKPHKIDKVKPLQRRKLKGKKGLKINARKPNIILDDKTLEILNNENIQTKGTKKQIRSEIDYKLENKLDKLKAKLEKGKKRENLKNQRGEIDEKLQSQLQIMKNNLEKANKQVKTETKEPDQQLDKKTIEKINTLQEQIKKLSKNYNIMMDERNYHVDLDSELLRIQITEQAGRDLDDDERKQVKDHFLKNDLETQKYDKKLKAIYNKIMKIKNQVIKLAS
jgi:hypothetical protein